MLFLQRIQPAQPSRQRVRASAQSGGLNTRASATRSTSLAS